MDEEGNMMENNTTKMQTDLRNHRVDLDRLLADLSSLYSEFKAHKAQSTEDHLSTASHLHLESMGARVES